MLTISALVTPRMLGGPTYKVMATLVYDDFLQTLDWPSGAAMSFVLTGLTLLVIGLSSRLLKRWGGALELPKQVSGCHRICSHHIPADSGPRRGAGRF